MTGPDPTPTGPDEHSSEGGVADALRTAVERTMKATAGSAATSRDRATGLLDDIVRRGREARGELARRGQEAGAELARRGQEATGEAGRRIELLEQRLAELERRLGPEAGEPDAAPGPTVQYPKSEPEG
jgi:polyhydroxyalkanoate synthesis regulator phasin